MKIKLIAAALAAFFMIPLLCGTAYAYGDDPDRPEETPEVTYAPDAPVTDYPETPPKPFTPAGTGTVIDTATDGDGKEFFTIMTPDENVFYLVIDRQRGTENVYFLNAVTEADLMALAEIPEKPVPAPVEPNPAPTQPEPDPTPPAPEQSGGNMGMIVIVAVLVLLGGGAGWYFKIYRPKQQKAGMDEDYGGDEPDFYDGSELDAEPEDDNPPWYDDDETPDGDGGDE